MCPHVSRFVAFSKVLKKTKTIFKVSRFGVHFHRMHMDRRCMHRVLNTNKSEYMWTGASELLHHLSSTLRGPSWTRLESLQNEQAISNFGCHFAQSTFFPVLGVQFYWYFSITKYYQIVRASKFVLKVHRCSWKCLKNARGIYRPDLFADLANYTCKYIGWSVCLPTFLHL